MEGIIFGGEEAALISIIFGILGLVLLAMLVPVIFYLLTLQRNLKLCGQNAQMAPGLVWLNLIPLFNLVWGFVTVLKVSRSNQLAAQAAGRDVGDGGQIIGILFMVFGLLALIPFIGILLGLASLVLWIVFWVKIAGFSADLRNAPVAATEA